MKTLFNTGATRAASIVACFLLLSAFSTIRTTAGHQYRADQVMVLDEVDGTQLALEARQLLAETFHLNLWEVSAVYCCQLTDGRFKYNATIPVNNSGIVYFTVVGGQIIENDIEGF